MAIQSTQYAGLVATPRVKPNPQDSGNSIAMFRATTPTTYAAQAVNELFDLFILPKSTLILPFGVLENATNAASVTLAIGLRSLATGTVVSATQLLAATAITTAARTTINSGAAFTAGVGYICTEDMIVYATFAGATSTANAQISVYLPVVTLSA
jgi:hypothetical protein